MTEWLSFFGLVVLFIAGLILGEKKAWRYLRGKRHVEIGDWVYEAKTRSEMFLHELQEQEGRDSVRGGGQ